MQTVLYDARRLCIVELWRSFLPQKVASALFFEAVSADTNYQPESFVIMGSTITTKRRTIGYGDSGVSYRYAGAVRPAHAWPEYVTPVKTGIEAALTEHTRRPVHYNYMLATLYADGGAGLGYHADDEPEIDQSTPIVSLSLGAGRDFCLRDKATKAVVAKVNLGAGDLLSMRGKTQKFYQHAVPERSSRGNTRISWTFRAIVRPGERAEG